MLSELKDISKDLQLSKEEREFVERVSENDILKCGTHAWSLTSADIFERRCGAMAIIQRLYDVSKGYTTPMQVGAVLSQHSSYTELPLSRNTRIKMLKFGRVELKDLWKLALHHNLYDAAEAILHIHELGVVKYQPRKDNVEC